MPWKSHVFFCFSILKKIINRFSIYHMSSLYAILLYSLFVTIWCKDNKQIFSLSRSLPRVKWTCTTLEKRYGTSCNHDLEAFYVSQSLSANGKQSAKTMDVGIENKSYSFYITLLKLYTDLYAAALPGAMLGSGVVTINPDSTSFVSAAVFLEWPLETFTITIFISVLIFCLAWRSRTRFLRLFFSTCVPALYSSFLAVARACVQVWEFRNGFVLLVT